ncbi:hypothetical protein GCM10020001_020750 [Nonomuraea salmonea]
MICAALGSSTTPTATIVYADTRRTAPPMDASASSPATASAASRTTAPDRHPALAVLTAAAATTATGATASSNRFSSPFSRGSPSGLPSTSHTTKCTAASASAMPVTSGYGCNVTRQLVTSSSGHSASACAVSRLSANTPAHNPRRTGARCQAAASVTAMTAPEPAPRSTRTTPTTSSDAA